MVACDNAIKTRGHFEKLKIPVAVKACDGHDMSICCKKKNWYNGKTCTFKHVLKLK